MDHASEGDLTLLNKTTFKQLLQGIYSDFLKVMMVGEQRGSKIFRTQSRWFEQWSKPVRDIPLNPGWLMGILVMAYYNPYTTG